MASKFDGDVRPLSNNQTYMGVVFEGLMDDAIAQARAAPDHGLADQVVPAGMSRARAVLLQHLNLLPTEAQIQVRVDGFVDQAFIDHLNFDPRN